MHLVLVRDRTCRFRFIGSTWRQRTSTRTKLALQIVTRSISGHATPEMQRHYSTVSAAEQRAGLAKVIDLAFEREKRAA